MMPFDLRLHYVPRHGDTGWEMNGPGWLTLETLPFDKKYIRELLDQSYGRDRYAPISAEELMAWHERVWGDAPVEESGEYIRESYETFMTHVGRARPSEMYMLCWYEWESGLN